MASKSAITRLIADIDGARYVAVDGASCDNCALRPMCFKKGKGRWRRPPAFRGAEPVCTAHSCHWEVFDGQ